MITNVHWSSCKVPVGYSGQFTKLEFSRQIFENYCYLKFHENPLSGSRRTDGQSDITKITVALRNIAKVPNTITNLNYV
jgi:hypothetical protein